MNRKELSDIFIKQKQMEVLKQSEKNTLKKYLKEKSNLILRKVRSTLIFRNLKVYDSLDTLRIIDFWKINQTGNIYLLDKNYFEGKLYQQKEVLYFQKLWLSLQDDYYKLQDDPKQRAKIRTSKERMLLMFKTQVIISHLAFYERFFKYAHLLDTKQYIEQEHQLFSLFKELGLKANINRFSTPEEKLKKIRSFVDAVSERLKRLQKESEKDASDEIENMFTQVVAIEKIIERPIPNIENISVMQWIAYEKQAREIIQANKKDNGKK